MKKYVILLLLPFLIHCNNPGKKINIPTIDVYPDNNLTIKNGLSYSHFVVLTSPDEYLIGDIYKIQLINDHIYILDQTKSSVFIFDKNGSFIYRFNKKGRSSNEYLIIQDFEIDQQGNIHILDDLNDKFFVYDQKGNFLNATPARSAAAFKLLNNGLIAYNIGNGSSVPGEENLHNYICTKENNVIIKDIPFNKGLVGRRLNLGVGKSSFYLCQNEIYTTFPLNDTIYQVDKNIGILTPFLAFDLKTVRPMPTDSPQKAIDYFNDIIKSDIPSSPFGFNKHNDKIRIQFINQHRFHTIRANINGTFIENGIAEYDDFGLPYSPMSYYDSDNTGFILSVIHSHNLEIFTQLATKKNKDLSVITEINSALINNENPILVFYTIPE